jgi:hypothetical protein
VAFSARAIRAWFCVTVALAALAIADPLTEWVSNGGWFGPGNFTDHSNADIIPVVLAGLAFGVLHVASRGCYAARASGRHRHRWFDAWAGVLDDATVLRLIPRTFAIQIAALWVAESLEQYAIAGHGLGGTVWLGAPVLAALAVHGAFCALVTYAAALAIRALAAPVLRVAALVAAFAKIVRAKGPATIFVGLAAPRLRAASPLVCQIGERAPPFVTA